MLFSRAALLGLITCLLSFNSHAITPLFDGGFESGTLQGWNPAGVAVVATRGTCFSSGDTTQIRARGQYAGLLRSTGEQLSSFTSKSFIAGTGLSFLGLSELKGKRKKINPFAINVSILDGTAKVLRTQTLATAMIKLANGCPSSKRDHSFSTHFISTREFQGKQIKVRFTQHQEIAKTGGFTLIDEVGVVDSAVPIYLSYPNARAGIIQNSGVVALTAGLPFGDIEEQTIAWQYSWFINGETSERPCFNPCINDLEPGAYTANLYIQDTANSRLATDTFNFLVPDSVDDEVVVPTVQESSTTASSTSSTITGLSNTASCNARHPIDLINPGNPGDPGTVPIVTSLLTNSPFTANSEGTLFSSVVLVSGTSDTLTKAVIEIENAQTGDKMVDPSVSELNGLTANGCASTICTLTGTGSTTIYETVLQALKIELGDSTTSRMITLTIFDSGNISSLTISRSITVAQAAPTIDTLEPNLQFTANIAKPLFSSVVLSSNTSDILTKATVAIENSQSSDQLVDLTDADLDGLTVSACSAIACTIYGTGGTAAYEATLMALQVLLADNTGRAHHNTHNIRFK